MLDLVVARKTSAVGTEAAYVAYGGVYVVFIHPAGLMQLPQEVSSVATLTTAGHPVSLHEPVTWLSKDNKSF